MDLVTLRLSCSSGGSPFLTDPEMISKSGEPYSMQRFQNAGHPRRWKSVSKYTFSWRYQWGHKHGFSFPALKMKSYHRRCWISNTIPGPWPGLCSYSEKSQAFIRVEILLESALFRDHFIGLDGQRINAKLIKKSQNLCRLDVNNLLAIIRFSFFFFFSVTTVLQAKFTSSILGKK